MSQCKPRVVTLTCPLCRKPFRRARQGLPSRACRRCARTTLRRKRAPALGRGSEDPRELGPDKPLLGWTASQYQAWRQQQAVRLYLEEGLGADAIAERLGYTRQGLQDVLYEAGIRLRGDGRDFGDDALPLGTPT